MISALEWDFNMKDAIWNVRVKSYRILGIAALHAPSSREAPLLHHAALNLKDPM